VRVCDVLNADDGVYEACGASSVGCCDFVTHFGEMMFVVKSEDV
jgi:hypothetical protein